MTDPKHNGYVVVPVLTTARSSYANEKNLSYLFQSWESSRSVEGKMRNDLAARPSWPFGPFEAM